AQRLARPLALRRARGGLVAALPTVSSGSPQVRPAARGPGPCPLGPLPRQSRLPAPQDRPRPDRPDLLQAAGAVCAEGVPLPPRRGPRRGRRGHRALGRPLPAVQPRPAGRAEPARRLVGLLRPVAAADGDLVSHGQAAEEHRRARLRRGLGDRRLPRRPHHAGPLVGARLHRPLLGELPRRAPPVHARAVLEAARPSPRRPRHPAGRANGGGGGLPRGAEDRLGPLVIADLAAFVAANTRLQPVPHAPEISLWLADEVTPLWRLTEEELGEMGLPPPFWAFAWAGGQGLARYLLDHPAEVAGRTVLDFAAGSGLVGVAAMRAGAASVLCADIDPFAGAAVAANAGAN